MPDDAQASAGVARLTGYVPIVTRGPVRPHLLGGVCASMAIFQKKGERDLLYSMIGGELGAGVRLVANRHWALQCDYIHGLLDLKQEFVDQEGDDVDIHGVGRRGRSESLRIALTWDF